MKRLLFLLCLLTTTIISQAQSKQEQGAIKSLCGCYDVKFMYAEIFPSDTASKFTKPYKTGGLEWVVADETTDKKIILQHLLVISDSMIIKHWREDWEYEKNDWWVFAHDATWKHVTGTKPVKGEWTQTVWEVDDAPRYQGTSKWITNNNQYYWENTTDAPLPRREYTKRKDYNVMQRGNKIILTDTGWVHEQDNSKIVRVDGAADRVIALEKGYNIYRKVDDAKCKMAQAWWEKHKAFWVNVRQTWSELLKNKTVVRLIPKVDDELLYEKLDHLEDEKLDQTALKAKTKEILQKYIDQNYTAPTAKRN